MKNQYAQTVRKLTVTGIMSAVSFVLMLIEVSTPFTPEFLKFDLSDLPAFITSFALGPIWGIAVELIKNLLHLPLSGTGGVGELANFLVGVVFVLTAGLVYKLKRNRSGALIGSICGSFLAAAVSLPINYYITYPFYFTLMSKEVIIQAYSTLFPFIDSIFKALLFVNLPFTLVKGIICSVITFAIYKKLSPILKGNRKETKND